MNNNWQEQISKYCNKYNIPIQYLSETLYEPKVVPMIRGKAFEFSAMVTLQRILPNDFWQITKVVMNAQLGSHDVDITVKYKPTGKTIRCECKLAGKEGYRYFPPTLTSEESHQIRVKCMRSRTLGTSVVQQLSPLWGIPEEVISAHNDNYLPTDFDAVICSIGNSFYRTNPDGIFEWTPTEDEIAFLNKLKPPTEIPLKDFTFNRMYLAKSLDLAVGSSYGVKCIRRKCNNKDSCGFIPDYPIIRFNASAQPVNGWVSIDNAAQFFNSFIID